MASFGEKNMYAIIEFVDNNSNDKKDIDLIPSKWITEISDEFLCQYPPQNDYANLKKYAQEYSDAKKDWPIYTIQILAYADNFKQGQRRLHRALTTTDVKSTAKESSKSTSGAKPKILTNVAIASRKKKHSSQKKKLNNDESQNDTLGPIDKRDEVFDIQSLKVYFDKKLNDLENSIKRHIEDSIKSHIEDSFKRQIEDSIKSTIEDSFKRHIEDSIKSHIEDSFKRHIEDSIKKNVASEKESSQKDLKKNFDELKNTLQASNMSETPRLNISDPTTKLNVKLPCTDLEEFKKFDDDLKSSESKKKALLDLLRVLIYGQTTARGCIGKMASAVMTKSVEKHYSGTGRITKGIGKLNFSSTETFQCMRDLVAEKFGDSDECKNFAGKVGRWLSGSNDRAHGRKRRSRST